MAHSRTILITGGAGFIGTHLCRALIKKGHQVRVLDIGAPKAAVAKIEYIRGDVRRPNDLDQAMRGVDAVYHFAALVSVPYCEEHPDESRETNLIGTANVLDAIEAESAKRKTPIRIIFAGSSAAYGDSGAEGEPRQEDAKLPTPASLYAGQKLESENLIAQAHRKHGIPAIVFRFFNVYGPGQDPSSPYSGVISVFAKMIIEQKPLRLDGGGNQTRDFVSVHDVVHANVLALNLSAEKCGAQPINLGTGRSISIRKLAEEMMAVCEIKVSTIEASRRQGDVLHSVADINRAKTILGWNPKTSLRQGLVELLGAKK